MKTKILFLLSLSIIHLGWSQTANLNYTTNNVELNLLNTTLVVDTALAGRIISLKIEDDELLFQKKGSNDNFGSTFWSSPQSTWSWPPPAILNNNPYIIIKKDAQLVKLISGTDTKTKYRFSKTYGLSPLDTSFRIVYTVANTATTTKKIAPWEITRYPSGGIVFFPQRLEGETMTGALVPLIEDIDQVSWFDYDSTTIPKTGTPKLFSDGSEGWLAYVTLQGQLVVKKFSDSAPADRATTAENEIELYTATDLTYYEVEQQGKYQSIMTNDSLTWEVKWFVRQVPSTIKIEKGNPDLVKYVRMMLKGSLSNVQSLKSNESYRFVSDDLLVVPSTIDNDIQVYNLLGQVVDVNVTDLGDELQLDLSALNSGGYVVKSTVFQAFKFIR
jgi:hypothetical protein